MSEKTKEQEPPEVVARGFCRACRIEVEVVKNKKGKTECGVCGVPRVDFYS